MNNMNIRWLVLWMMMLFMLPISGHGQTLELERGVRAAGLWCFPKLNQPNEWVYIPAAGQLAIDELQQPEFSFVLYAINKPGETDSASSITQADGGGIVHFLVLYDTPQEQVSGAQRELRRLTDNDELKLAGPIVFDGGRYTLISSIINADGAAEKRVLATGAAPVLEGNQVALSFQLNPEKAMLLMESFKMATPDISIVFDLEFSGVTDAYEARVHVDWEEMRKNQAFSAGATVYWISADVEAEIDRLIRNNSIRMESVGADANTEALVGRIYEKLLDMLFAPKTPEQVPEDQRGGLMDALDSLVGQGGMLSSGQTTGFGAHVGYQLKDLRSEGVTTLDFNHRARVQRHAYISFNIGDLYQRHGSDSRFFRRVNIGDEAFQQREIHVGIDGELLPEFEDMINSVTVTLRKQHESGDVTLQERVVNRQALGDDLSTTPFIYGWKQDSNRMAWLDYQYRTQWSFKGGGQHQSEWIDANAAMIDLYTPYERRTIQTVDAGLDLSNDGVRAMVINITYPFFSIIRREQMVIRPNAASESEQVEITLPRDVYEYDYQITWIMQDGSRPKVMGKDNSGLVFLDLPSE